MSITESNLSSASQQLTSNINKSHSANTSKQVVSGQSGSSDTFTYVFNALQQAQGNTSSVSTENGANNIKSLQQNLFSSLGLTGGESGKNMLDQLTSDSSIEALQATLLNALQVSLLSPKPVTQSTTSNEGAASTTNSSNTATHNGLLP